MGWGCHITRGGAATSLGVGLPHHSGCTGMSKLCGISIAVIDIAVTGIAVTGIAVTGMAVTGSAVTSLAGGHPAASTQHRLSAEDEGGAVDLDIAACAVHCADGQVERRTAA